ncbi:hypothetical protein [Acinetobacter sp. MD2]|uniref:hypothetical protein n=1 Tax=Acinetobacter sp. MD2 TaxID=2600066 RepID=UPI002D1E6EAD|nr:hypothetical protein [Acinetobacter sp. MD2]MEB3767108.1 hypothetical protein [Acinetobacter sp. MD2]
MQALIGHLSQFARQVYEKTSGFIEEEREIPVTEAFFNATLKRYVTDNVGLLKDLHADLHEDWLRLYATIDIQGIYAEVSVDLKLLQMELNKKTQLLVFEQISETKLIKAEFKSKMKKWGVHSALFFYQKILKQDPLGKILAHFNIVQVKDDLLFLDLNRWLGQSASILDILNKVHVNRAQLAEQKMLVLGNINLEAIFRRSPDFALEAAEISNDETITPQNNA